MLTDADDLTRRLAEILDHGPTDLAVCSRVDTQPRIHRDGTITAGRAVAFVRRILSTLAKLSYGG